MRYYYSIAPDVAVVRLKEEAVLLKSDVLSIKLEGASALLLAEKVLPLLNGENELGDVVARLGNIAAEDLRSHLDELVRAGVLTCSNERRADASGQTIPSYFTNLLAAMGKDEKLLAEGLAGFKVAVIGLDAHGTQTVLSLVPAGIPHFLLADPFPVDNSYLSTFPFLRPYAGAGVSKQDCLKGYLQAIYPAVMVDAGPTPLTKTSLGEFLSDSKLNIVCMDKGFSAIYYWVNQLSADSGAAALYGTIRGHVCFAGPLVVPGVTSCYMCYKMRQVATADNFDEGMSYEEYLNDRKTPAFAERTVLPAAIPLLSAVLAAEATKYALSLGALSLCDTVMEYNILSLQTASHHLICKPDCPVCGKKKWSRQHPGPDELAGRHQPSRLAELLDALSSPHTGIIMNLEPMNKDITEPAAPYIFVARLANHSFLPKDQYEMLKCSGKGMDIPSARISAAGEAIERYSGTIYQPEEIVYSPFSNLDGRALDPRRLVLYSADQYTEVAYQPFCETEPIGWMEGYSLVHQRSLLVPAHGTLLNYAPRHPREHLFQATSNGLATGGSLLSAVLSASLELIERDAFVITWHQQLPAGRVSLKGFPDEDMLAMEAAYRRRGVELSLYLLPTDGPVSVAMCIGLEEDGEGPAAVVGLGSAFTAAKAARKALLEVGQIRPALRRRMRMADSRRRLAELIEDPKQVEELEDHDLLYAHPRHLHAFDFLFKQQILPIDWRGEKELTAAEQLLALTGYCRHKGTDLIYSNLTPPDMEALGLYTVRATIPELQPIHFGWKNIRLGGNRLFELPMQLGFSRRRATLAEMHSYPHPLS